MSTQSIYVAKKQFKSGVRQQVTAAAGKRGATVQAIVKAVKKSNPEFTEKKAVGNLRWLQWQGYVSRKN